MTTETPKKYVIDATNRTLGRVASEAARALMGKKSVDFSRNKILGVPVHIEHASKLRISQKKKIQTRHTRYSGYPGGLKIQTLGELIEKKGHGAALAQAVKGMLPKNKLRDRLMKHLTIAP